MPQNVYEGLFILDSNKYAKKPADVSGKVAALIEKQGGEVLVSRLWEERRLAYPIKGQRKGTYWLTYFRMDSLKLVDLNQETQRTEQILRHLVLKVDPRLVDTLISHAQSVPEKAAPPATVKADDKKAAEVAGEAKKDEAKDEAKGEAAVEESAAAVAVAEAPEADTPAAESPETPKEEGDS